MNVTSFILGLIMVSVIGFIGNFIASNHQYKSVTRNDGIQATCQVVRYRFWYEIKNCSKEELNKTQVGLNEIKGYSIQ